jgi:hypothetical protein
VWSTNSLPFSAGGDHSEDIIRTNKQKPCKDIRVDARLERVSFKTQSNQKKQRIY